MVPRSSPDTKKREIAFSFIEAMARTRVPDHRPSVCVGLAGSGPKGGMLRAFELETPKREYTTSQAHVERSVWGEIPGSLVVKEEG